MHRVCTASSGSALRVPSPQDLQHMGADHRLLRREAPRAGIHQGGLSWKVAPFVLIGSLEAYSRPWGPPAEPLLGGSCKQPVPFLPRNEMITVGTASPSPSGGTKGLSKVSPPRLPGGGGRDRATTGVQVSLCRNHFGLRHADATSCRGSLLSSGFQYLGVAWSTGSQPESPGGLPRLAVGAVGGGIRCLSRPLAMVG